MLPSVATLTASYSRINCPTVIIAGRDDQIVDSEQASRLQEVISHATLTLVADLGHMVHYFVADQIARTAEAITSEDAKPAPKPRIALG